MGDATQDKKAEEQRGTLEAVQAEIDHRFTYHPPKGDQADRYSMLRERMRAVAEIVVVICPNSRERSLALTKLEEAVMWANASIARHE